MPQTPWIGALAGALATTLAGILIGMVIGEERSRRKKITPDPFHCPNAPLPRHRFGKPKPGEIKSCEHGCGTIIVPNTNGWAFHKPDYMLTHNYMEAE